MKNIPVTFIVFFILTSVPILSIECSSKDSINTSKEIKTNKLQKMAEESPNINTIPIENSLKSESCKKIQPLDLWDLLFQFDLEEESGANGNMGAECTVDGFWSTRWQSNLQHQYDDQGNLIKEFTVSGVSNIHDLAWDNTKELMAGGAAGGTIWGWDPIGETLEYTITGSFQARALAYNEDDDVFYVSNWTDPVWVVDREGTVVDQFDLEITTSTSGFAYDRWTESGPYLFVFDQASGDPDLIYQWDIACGEFVGEPHDVGIDLGVTGGIAGGLFFSEVYYSCMIVGGILQGLPDYMFGYEMGIFWCPHDVGIKKIISPENDVAGENMEVIIQVENYGVQTEHDVPVNVVILKDGIDEEYNETKYIDKIEWGETVDVEMPTWTPDDWQNANNESIDYKITAYATVFYDINRSNDYKEEWFELYFGYLHDVGSTGIISPISGPAQTFPVISKIKNFGQHEECCFKTYMEIAELDIDSSSELLAEDFSGSTFPPAGWTRTHDNWMYNSSSHAGGSSGEARFNCSPLSTDSFLLYTYAIDTSDCDVVEIEFKHLADHNNTPYTLKVETSVDGANWDVIWYLHPFGDIDPETIKILTEKNVGSTIYVSWTYSGYSGNINSWYIDDIVIDGYASFDPEYEEHQCTTTIEPGEEMELYFSEWTPEFLAEETTGTKKYSVKTWTNMYDPEDENPTNDLYAKSVKLDFFHDVGVKEITSPTQKKQEIRSYLDRTKELTNQYVYVAIGNQEIECIVENIGTFPALDLTCYSEIYEYITNCTNGTLVYEDNITNIDLEEPLGGTYTCIFDDYNFAIEGTYSLEVSIPYSKDDYPKNNKFILGIGADGTPPDSWHSLVPEDPDGDNGWYVSDVEVTLTAADPSIGCSYPGSGVKEIRYKIGTGSWQTIPGSIGTFNLTVANDANDLLIEYYSIDKVGNEESHHTFTIDMDQTIPDMEQVQWEAVKIFGSWHVEFTCNVTDATSGMNRVVMYIDDSVHEINTEPDGSVYKFVIKWSTAFKTVTFKFEHYDNAGNMDYDEILGKNIESTSTSTQKHTKPKTTTQDIIKNSR